MRTSRVTVVAALGGIGLLAPAIAGASNDVVAAVPIATEQTICEDVFGGVYDPPSSEPLAQCQWDMALIHANESTWARATGEGVVVGVLDSGVDIDHPDIVPN